MLSKEDVGSALQTCSMQHGDERSEREGAKPAVSWLVGSLCVSPLEFSSRPPISPTSGVNFEQALA